jgi:hypothetical protein
MNSEHVLTHILSSFFASLKIHISTKIITIKYNTFQNCTLKHTYIIYIYSHFGVQNWNVPKLYTKTHIYNIYI